MNTPITILERLTELEHQGIEVVQKMARLKEAYAFGYRYLDEDDELLTGGENVVNISTAVKK